MLPATGGRVNRFDGKTVPPVLWIAPRGPLPYSYAAVQANSPLRPCVFFDRDGIVNRSPGPGYVERVEDFHLLPEFVTALRLVLQRGYEAVIITNQRGVGKGQMSQATLDAIHDHLRALLAREGLSLRDIYFCTEVDRDHPRLKPQPGMLFEAARDHQLDLARSWMIGDNEKDVMAGQRAGCRTLLVREGAEPTVAEFRVPSMAEVPEFLARHLHGGS